MPSLPVNNQALSSQEDSYRRYFGACKSSSPAKPRRLLLSVLIKICAVAMILSAFPLFMLYMHIMRHAVYESYHLYFAYSFTQMCITFCWCLLAIHIIFEHQYANFRIMTFNAFCISLLSFVVSSILGYLCHSNAHHYRAIPNLNTDIWDAHYWRIDIMYFCIFRLPLTLYFSILAMYCIQFRHCCSKLFSTEHETIPLPNYFEEQEVEVFECVSSATGTDYQFEYAADDDLELSLLSMDRNDSMQAQFATPQDLEKAARSVVWKWMLIYCVLLMMCTAVWFVIITIHPERYENYRWLSYCILFATFHTFKALLKRSARNIDTAVIIVNFPFEILTEILASSFYWIQLRMFVVRYRLDADDLLSMIIIVTIHLSSEIFNDSIRMSSFYFKHTGYVWASRKKSTFAQWKVRGALDAATRFIISVYSILFVSVFYVIFPFYVIDENHFHTEVIFNYAVFGLELIYFSCILLVPGCEGRISQQKQINMAEPLMRIYNKNQQLFMGVFIGSMAMASLFLVV